MAYKSVYSGAEIDSLLGKANTALQQHQDISGKQDVISDLQTIRSGAQKGSTAVQPSQLKTVATSGSYNDLSNKPTIPSAVTESDISAMGFTKNSGTYSKLSSGIPKTDLASDVQASLGKADTALQSHQDISGKQDLLVSGTNIKTINGESIIGSGDINIELDTSNLATKQELATKQDIISDIDTIRNNAANFKGTVTSVIVDNVSQSPSSGVVDLGYINKKLTTSTLSSMVLLPNVYYRNISTSLSTLTINLAVGDNPEIINEYLVEFTTASSGTTISLPSSIKWVNGEAPTFKNGCTYQISIVNNLGVCIKFS